MASVPALSRLSTPVASATADDVVRHDDTRMSDARTPATHSHPQSDITNLATDLATKAPADIPIYIGQDTGTQSLTTNVFTAIADLDTEVIDTHNGHNPASNPGRWTCPTGWAGWYWVQSQVQHAANTTGSRFAAVYRNGSAVFGTPVMMDSVASGITAVGSGKALTFLDVGDYVEAVGWHNRGANNSTSATNGASATLTVIWARPA